MTSLRSSVWTLLLLLTSSILITACGGSSSSSTRASSNTVAPEPEAMVVSRSLTPGIREEIEVTFDEPMNPATLELEGMLAEIAARPEWSEGYRQLTLKPAEGAWESGRHTIQGSVRSASGAPVSLELQVEIRLVFETFQEASFVIGQPDFESSTRSKTPGPNTLRSPFGMPSIVEGVLWIPDWGNNRLLGFDGIPEITNPDASWVAGQENFTTHVPGTSAKEFSGPQMGLAHGGYFYLLEYNNKRISIFDHIPPEEASAVIGQEDLDKMESGCSPVRLNSPEAMFIVGDKLLVADSGNNRVLIWNSVPKDISGQPADVVLGQTSMDRCERNNGGQLSERTLAYPAGLWSDGERLAVADERNGRVLVWNSFPSANFAPADLVVGAPDFATGRDWNAPPERSLYGPYGVWSNGLQLFVTDWEASRILIWDEFPTENGQPADKVLGQPELDLVEYLIPSAQAFGEAGGLVVYRDKLVAMDIGIDRALIFEAQ